jgi:hypothetical protein
MRNTREPVRRRLRAGIAFVADVVTLSCSCVVLLRLEAPADANPRQDRDASVRVERFRELFGAALVEFSRNIAAWKRGLA